MAKTPVSKKVPAKKPRAKKADAIKKAPAEPKNQDDIFIVPVGAMDAVKQALRANPTDCLALAETDNKADAEAILHAKIIYGFLPIYQLPC